MSRRPIYMKSSHSGVKWLFIMVLLGYGGWWLWQHRPMFNLQDIVENSELRRKNFEAKVQEIFSPRLNIPAYLFEDKTNPIVSLNFLFKNAGYASDGGDEQGISQVVAAMLTEGAGEYTNEQIKERLEDAAVSISFDVDKDDFSGSLLTTKKHQKEAFNLLKLMLTKPSFDQAELVRVIERQMEALKRQQEHPQNLLELNFLQELYGNHPYGRNPLGKTENIKKLTPEKLNSFVRNNLTRQNVIIGIAGDIDANEAGVMIDDVFGKLSSAEQINFVRSVDAVFDGRELIREYAGSGQNIVMKAVGGVGRSDKDFYPLFVANYILGGSGLNSRLSKSLREDNGLVYSVYSYMSLADKSPLLSVVYSTTPENHDKAERLFQEEWDKIAQGDVSEEELLRTKNYLTASYNLRFASLTGISELLVGMQKYNLGLDFLQKRNDYVNQVTLEEVNSAARTYLGKNKPVSVRIGRFVETKE